jgi:drug/metabolite transporter (DMT)-like permease
MKHGSVVAEGTAAIPPKALLFIILTAFIFSTMEVALKIGAATIDPFEITFLRFLIGGLVLMPFSVFERKRRAESLTRRDALCVALLGLLCVPVCMMFFQFGVARSHASTVAVLFSGNPIFTTIFAHFMGRDDKINRRKILSLCIAAAGIFFMIRPWDMETGNTAVGFLFTITSALLFALYTVLGAKSAVRVGAFTQTAFSFLSGCAALLIVMISLGRPIFADVPSHIPILLYLGVVVTGFGFVFLFTAIKHSGASIGAYAFFIKPCLATLLAALLLRESVLWNSAVGIALILTASWINLRRVAD